jgi:hypothetical protein
VVTLSRTRAYVYLQASISMQPASAVQVPTQRDTTNTALSHPLAEPAGGRGWSVDPAQIEQKK